MQSLLSSVSLFRNELNNLKNTWAGMLDSIYNYDYACNVVMDSILQLIHSFEVNIRFCQPKNCDVHQDKADVNSTSGG